MHRFVMRIGNSTDDALGNDQWFTQLQAACEAGLLTLPVLLHKDCSDGDVAFLAQYDNDNDEYVTGNRGSLRPKFPSTTGRAL